MTRPYLRLVLTAAALSSAGCSYPVFNDPVTISTRHLEPVGRLADRAPIVSGRSCSRFTLLLIPLGVGTASFAFDKALEQSEGADTLVDWHMKVDALAIVGSLIYLESCITVEGKAIDSKQLVAGASDPQAAQSFIAHWDAQRSLAEELARHEEGRLARAGGGQRKFSGSRMDRSEQ